MPGPEQEPNAAQRKVAAQRTAARQQLDQADAALEKASRDRLVALARQSVDARFKALGEDDGTLLPHHRRQLLNTLQSQEGSRRGMPVAAGFASRWEVVQARLRYRVMPLALFGSAVLTGIVLVIVARARTPEFWVHSAYAQDLPIEFRTDDGQVALATLKMGESYALVSEKSGQVTLRHWVPGRGYAIATAPANWLARNP